MVWRWIPGREQIQGGVEASPKQLRITRACPLQRCVKQQLRDSALSCRAPGPATLAAQRSARG